MTTIERRKFLQTAGMATAAASTLIVPRVYGQATDDKLRVALVGCGGRGTGAANNALSVDNAQTTLHAMADVVPDRLQLSYSSLSNEYAEQPGKVDVPPERRFVGFEAYKQALDTLRPGDIALFATPLAFRWVHYQYAIERGLHVFMEKPVIADGPSAKRMLDLSAQADAKNLKCAVGLMVRHCRGRQELHQRIQDGEIGDIISMRAYRMHGPVASAFSTRKPDDQSETMFQIERFHSFLWASGGLFSDFYIHQIDETSWMKNAWPIKAHALGGRHYRGDYIDQNFDHYSVEYTYDDGTKLHFNGRTMLGCKNDMSSMVHGSKGSAIVSTSGHTPGKVKTFSGQNADRKEITWKYPQPEKNPYELEWVDLVDAIINDKPYNEVPRGVEASLVTSMGRMSAHTGQEITYDQMLNCPHEFAPDADKLSPEGPAPIMPNEDGTYSVPQPGLLKDREYA
ncbi:Gfo/Idh/MocA family oxidoreductase [Rubripirellula amarantea]|uniref:Inositol 2-dehydrogenase/D-chiro-inositol 3-dehydrogenase n=1 Tax=Rubripirellula amarantea TaxID=2527999 RepID=A0A5C5WUB1_9BACT|nr:Gfo/Idh/MocA family oxidoreductase [Rubripirellula amarantea]MDA8743057.1 Gfo/Idh/MocA family oxidoreductase [Rubripirellula amarantea]TWT53595.1 Inositol 2-dehydrogenase/D-chiro-inositol 3-dehydrogenase [Rubripirellula amarantea]